ncbi:SAF domain-containing protein [Microterricola pindariensis]|uniref:SAF domain-containing protein n=1 Tax=Microterricola pindariensis TaxID=478010 RepID=A0ABX5AZ21_9MICO|nr:SAF domain-containing protein [Microterricola pindariensis]PPL20163.1 hypothetical protein GY24_02265 [Microterricola pindariensis]
MGQVEGESVRGSKRPFWFDPRFAVGIVLVAGSIVGVSAIVAGVDDTAEVYAARGMLPAGTTITAAQLEAAPVRLGAVGERYLAVGELPEEGLVLTRAVAAGELIPASALSPQSEAGQTGVVVALSGDIAAAVAPGAPVDLWAAEQLEHGRFGPPAVILSAAEVVRVIDGGGILGGQGRSVELRLPTAKVAAVLQAVANGDALSLVPASMAQAGE